MGEKDPVTGAIIIPPELNLFHYVNGELAKFLELLNKTQVYLDDWAVLPQETKDLVKSRLEAFIVANGSLLADVKNYVNGL